jgi:predicted signal transduction protein with EAL and GGDEF domain
VRLAIDDFGTGYSSLAYLVKLPVQVLKIDRSFITGLHEDPDNRTLVRSILKLAADLRLQTVAEGIEAVEQAEELRRLGCDKGQGYWFSRPLTSNNSSVPPRRGQHPQPVSTRPGIAPIPRPGAARCAAPRSSARPPHPAPPCPAVRPGMDQRRGRRGPKGSA